MRSASAAIIGVALLLPVIASAQALGGMGTTDPFMLSLSPQYPAPNSTATLSFVSTLLDLPSSTLRVSVNGKDVYKGTVQPVGITLGKAGIVTAITATITSAGTDYPKSLSVAPQDLSLVAEPIASVPPLYPGKAFVPLEGSVRAVAVANFRTAAGAPIDPATLSYAWSVDGTAFDNLSGIGKTAFVVASPLQYRSRTVKVTVTNPNGSQVSGATLSLTPMQPSVRLYKNDPLLGIQFDRALGGTLAVGSEQSLYAAPFSFPTTSGMPVMRWFLNGDAVQTGSLITLRPSGSGQGSASLSFTASSGQLTTASANLSLTFGTKSSSFFGL